MIGSRKELTEKAIENIDESIETRVDMMKKRMSGFGGTRMSCYIRALSIAGVRG